MSPAIYSRARSNAFPWCPLILQKLLCTRVNGVIGLSRCIIGTDAKKKCANIIQLISRINRRARDQGPRSGFRQIQIIRDNLPINYPHLEVPHIAPAAHLRRRIAECFCSGRLVLCKVGLQNIVDSSLHSRDAEAGKSAIVTVKSPRCNLGRFRTQTGFQSLAS